MPVSRKIRIVLISLLWLAATGTVFGSGPFAVKSARVWVEGSDVVVKADMDLTLSDAAEAALTSGIPLDILIEFSLQRERALLWDKTLGEWTLRTEVRYHALSGLYLVSLQRGGDVRSFPTQRSALAYIGTLDRVSLPMPQAAPDEHRYRLDMRVRMDRESLPLPLRPVAYTSPDWRLNSEWSQWIVQASPAA